ncbi:hypothetical protein D9N18_11125, partial [Lactococcus raffinolactis]|nr:hypothetical protein [Lactococcus raffinolactis]
MEKNFRKKVLFLNKDKKVKQSRFRQWKSGKKWLYSATALALLVGGGFALSQ